MESEEKKVCVNTFLKESVVEGIYESPAIEIVQVECEGMIASSGDKWDNGGVYGN